MNRTRRVLDAVRRRIGPRAFAPLGSVLVSVRRRELCRVRYADGDWVHRYREGVVVAPVLGGASARMRDETTADLFLHRYQPAAGDVVIDLGAGDGGEVCLLSALVGPAGRVVSVEAHPRTFRRLCRTIELNGLTNVTPLRCAATDVSGTVYLEDGADTPNSNGLTDRATGIPVPGHTIAEIVSRSAVSRVDLLKMNIEGAELPALRTATEVLPIVRNLVVSCHDFKVGHPGPDPLRTYADVRRLLTDAGYETWTRQDDPRPWVRHYLYASRCPEVARR
jgi:FkbM family methyltransferase